MNLDRMLPSSVRQFTSCLKGTQVKSNCKIKRNILIGGSLHDMKHSSLRLGQRFYHCKTSVYGYNATLHQKRIEQNVDPKEFGYESLPRQRAAQPNLYRYVEAYRTHGHKIAQTNPVKPPEAELPSYLFYSSLFCQFLLE